MSLRRITERPFVRGRCPGSDTRWRLHPSGSARGRRDPARSSRPATTKATWRSVDPEKRWVLPVHLPCLSSAACCCGRRSGCRTPADLSFPELSTSSLCSHGRGATGRWRRRTSAHRGRSHVLSPRFWDESDGEASSRACADQISTGGSAAVKTLSFKSRCGGGVTPIFFSQRNHVLVFCSDSLISLCSHVGSKTR